MSVICEEMILVCTFCWGILAPVPAVECTDQMFCGVVVMGKRVPAEEIARRVKELETRGIQMLRYGGGVEKKSTFRCMKDGYEWDTMLSCLSAMGHGCPKCAGVARVTEDEARRRLVGRKIDLLKWGGSTGARSLFRCTECGREWSTTFSKVNSGTGCAKCSGKLRVTEAEARLRIAGRPFEMIRWGGGVGELSLFRCLVDGHEWQAQLTNVHGSGTGCPKCAGILVVSEAEALERLRGRNIELVSYGGSATSRSIFRCTLDGHQWESNVSAIDKGGAGCAKCAGNLQLTESEVVEYLRDRDVVLVRYGGTTMARSVFRCLVDGHEWETSLSHIRSGGGCPKCAGALVVDEVEARNRLIGRDIELVEWGGLVKAQSRFRCLVDGHEWLTTLDSIHNSGTGCPKCADYGFNPRYPSVFYVYDIFSLSSRYVGFGISGNFVDRSYKHSLSFAKAGARGDLLKTYPMDGHVAKSFEKIVKQNFPISDTGIEGFRTEAFEYDEELLGLLIVGAEHGVKISKGV